MTKSIIVAIFMTFFGGTVLQTHSKHHCYHECERNFENCHKGCKGCCYLFDGASHCY